MLDIVFIHPSPNPRTGGIVKAGLSYLRGLRARGHAVEVWTSSPVVAAEARTLVSRVAHDPAFGSAIGALAAPRTRGLMREARRRRVDAYLHNTGHLWALTPLLGADRSHVVFHNRKVGPRGYYRNWLAISSAQARRLEAEAARRPWVRSVRAIRNGLTSECPETEHGDRPTGHPLRIGALCEMRVEKGIDLLIAAAAELRRRGLPFTLVIGGDGADLLPKLQGQAAALGLSGAVEWRGWIEDVDAFYRDIDVFCLPSRVEPFGLVVIEAMIRGLPVVAAAADGPSDLVRDGETGWLVPVDDPAALATALGEALGSAGTRARIAEAGREFVAHSYSDDAVGAVLETALTVPAPPRRRPSG